MDRWKSRGGKSQRREGQKKEDQRRERVRRKKMQACEKVEKSRFTVFFQWFVAPEGRKVGSLIGGCGAIWPDERWKIARLCGAKHMSKSKCTKHTMFRPLLKVVMSKKCTPLWREAHLQVKGVKNWLGPLLDVQISFRVAGTRDCAPPHKWAKREAFVAVSETMAGVRHLKRIWKDAWRVAGAVQETCSSDMLRDFLRGVAFWRIRSSGLLRWFCWTGAALRMTWHHFVVAGAAF